jgi:adenylylsulfate kinase
MKDPTDARPGFVLWLTGLPSSGKSTLARAVRERLVARESTDGWPSLVLDGDEVRAALRPTPGYDPTARDDFYHSLSNLAALCAEQGLVVLVPATANLRAFRARARARCGARFAELFVDTPVDECATRDSKGLYRSSAVGAVSSLPGAGAEYQRPEAPELVVRPGDPDAAERVAQWLIDRVRALSDER